MEGGGGEGFRYRMGKPLDNKALGVVYARPLPAGGGHKLSVGFLALAAKRRASTEMGGEEGRERKPVSGAGRAQDDKMYRILTQGASR